jgi:multidrug transporter EmrE-like cation transporter
MAVWVAAIAFFAWGALWYALLFGNQWMAALGKTPPVSAPTTYLWSFVLGLILSYATGIALTRHPEDQSLPQGISFAVFMGIGLYATQTLNHVIYEDGSMTLWIINTAYTVIGFAIIGAVIGAWKARGAAA